MIVQGHRVVMTHYYDSLNVKRALKQYYPNFKFFVRKKKNSLVINIMAGPVNLNSLYHCYEKRNGTIIWLLPKNMVLRKPHNCEYEEYTGLITGMFDCIQDALFGECPINDNFDISYVIELALGSGKNHYEVTSNVHIKT